MRVSLTIRIRVSISHYASVLVFCMMDIWMFSLAKICRHAKGRREEAENGVVLHGGLYGPPYELPVGQNGGHGFSGKVISIIH